MGSRKAIAKDLLARARSVSGADPEWSVITCGLKY